MNDELGIHHIDSVDAGYRLLLAAIVRRAALDARRGDEDAYLWLDDMGRKILHYLGVRIKLDKWLDMTLRLEWRCIGKAQWDDAYLTDDLREAQMGARALVY